jgi:hypothetical protein
LNGFGGGVIEVDGGRIGGGGKRGATSGKSVHLGEKWTIVATNEYFSRSIAEPSRADAESSCSDRE